MDGPVISFDVSKGESHCRGFTASGKPFSSVFCFPHDKKGFDKVRKLALEIEKATGRKPSAVLESTGVYGMTLLSFLTAAKAEIYLISPLESAKMRKSEVRPTSTARRLQRSIIPRP